MLIFSVPDLRMRTLDDFLVTAQRLSELVAQRVGRHADDLAVRAFIGAVIGVLLAAFLSVANDPKADTIALIDESLAYLEAGLPL